LTAAEAGPVDDLGKARIDLLRAQIGYATPRSNETPRLLLNAAKRLELLDPELARQTYLRAFSASSTRVGRAAVVLALGVVGLAVVSCTAVVFRALRLLGGAVSVFCRRAGVFVLSAVVDGSSGSGVTPSACCMFTSTL